MEIKIWFWIIFVIGLIFHAAWSYRRNEFTMPSLFWWILIFLLGYKVFGSPID